MQLQFLEQDLGACDREIRAYEILIEECEEKIKLSKQTIEEIKQYREATVENMKRMEDKNGLQT